MSIDELTFKLYNVTTPLYLTAWLFLPCILIESVAAATRAAEEKSSRAQQCGRMNLFENDFGQMGSGSVTRYCKNPLMNS